MNRPGYGNVGKPGMAPGVGCPGNKGFCGQGKPGQVHTGPVHHGAAPGQHAQVPGHGPTMAPGHHVQVPGHGPTMGPGHNVPGKRY